jgi:hypothetical protein
MITVDVIWTCLREERAKDGGSGTDCSEQAKEREETGVWEDGKERR